MEIERAAVHRAMRGRGVQSVELIRSGIGKHAVVATLDRACRAAPTGFVILAGACGALRTVDDVPNIARVVDESGRAWTGAFGMDPDGVTLIAVDRIISSPQAKRQLAESSGASIVDMEAHAFAAACERIGVAWSIVRGVSDAPDETLPERVLEWISPDGRTRTLRAVMDLARRPSLIPHMRAVLARSRRVLPRVADRVLQLHDAWLAVPR